MIQLFNTETRNSNEITFHFDNDTHFTMPFKASDSRTVVANKLQHLAHLIANEIPRKR